MGLAFVLAIYPFVPTIFKTLVRIYYIILGSEPTIVESVKLNNTILGNKGSDNKSVIAVKDYCIEIEIIVNDNSKTWLLINQQKLKGRKFVLHNQPLSNLNFKIQVDGKKRKIQKSYACDLIQVEAKPIHHQNKTRKIASNSSLNYSLEKVGHTSLTREVNYRLSYQSYQNIKPIQFSTRIVTPKHLSNTLLK